MTADESFSSGYDTWEVSTKLLLSRRVRDQPEVLLMKYVGRDDGERHGLPGGHIDSDDASIEDAFLRELKEELGLKAGMLSCLKPLPAFIHEKGDRIILPFRALFQGQAADIIDSNPDKEVHRWVMRREVSNLALASCYKNLIKHELRDL